MHPNASSSVLSPQSVGSDVQGNDFLSPQWRVQLGGPSAPHLNPAPSQRLSAIRYPSSVIRLPSGICDPPAPNLLRDLFPYSEPPRIRFGHRALAPSPARDMFITDSTFREGRQARLPFTPDEATGLFDRLHNLSGTEGVIRQTEFFLYTPKDRALMDLCRSKGYRFPEVTGWIRASEKDIGLVIDAGLKETGILTSASDYHIYLKLGTTRKRAAETYLRVVRLALENGIVPRCGFEDITRSDVYGFSIPFAVELMKLREESGIDVKIRLSDTLGLGVTYPGAALPRGVPALVRAFIEDAGVPGHLLEWHGHNDFHHALVNSSSAWLYGCGGVSGALQGLGERTGTASIEALLVERSALRGYSLTATAPIPYCSERDRRG